jgi:hypothetical protein
VLTHPAGTPGTDSGVVVAGAGVAGAAGRVLEGVAGGGAAEVEAVVLAGGAGTEGGGGAALGAAVACHPAATPTEMATRATTTPPPTAIQARFTPILPASAQYIIRGSR